MVSREADIRGVLAMLGAVFFFSFMDACMKQLAASHSPMQVAFLRGAAGLPFVLAISLLSKPWRALIPNRWVLHVARGALSVFTLTAFVYAVSELSLGDAYSIFLAAPLIVTGLSALMLRERVDKARWLAIGVGLSGALIMLRPSGSGLLTLGGVAALAAAFAYALGVVLIRVASRTDTPQATMFWTMLVLTVISGVLSIDSWTAVHRENWIWVAAIGLTGALGQWLITEAFRRCEASVIAPFEYSALLWGVLLDWFIWQTLPQQRMFLGSAIVVGSGLYLIFHERRSVQAVAGAQTNGR